MVRLRCTFGGNREMVLSSLYYCVDTMVLPFLLLQVMISFAFGTIRLVDRPVWTT